MSTAVRALTSTIALLACVTGCGAAPAQPTQTASNHPAPRSDAEPQADPKAEAPAAATPKPAAESEPDPRADGLRKASRPPADLITGPNLVYVFNFKESEVGVEAKQKCAEKSDDPGAMGACLEKARSKVPVELIRFIKEPDGDLWWITYNRYKGNLLKWHRVQFKAGDATADRITLNLFGDDKGIAPMARVPRHLEIELPNDYSIVVKDPEFGAMMYDAKIGTMEVD
jgi:hypothetical protein